MSVYEAVRVCKEKSGKIYNTINVRAILRHICCFGLSVLFSLSGFNESFSPFGVAFTSCVSKTYTATAALGASIGYFIAMESVDALRYTASVLALAVIMTALKTFKTLRGSIYTPVLATFVCIFVTGIAVVFSNGFSSFSFVVCFCESAVGGACAYVFYKSRVYLSVSGCLKSVTSKEITAVVITCAILLLSFKYAVVFGVSLAHIIAVFLVLICGRYGKEAGGAIVGICCGITMCYGTNDLFLLSFYSLGGLLCGAVASYGKLACVSAFFVAGALIAVIGGFQGEWLPLAVELVFSALMFMGVSYKFNYQLESFFFPPVSSSIVDSVKFNVINKLHRASEFSTEICETLESVNDALSKTQKSDVTIVPQKVKNSVCGSCGLYDSCWSESSANISACFDSLLEMKRKGIFLDSKTMPQAFVSACIRSEAVSGAFNSYFSQCKLNEKTENRIREIQSFASEQFINVSSLLSSLCTELDEEVCYDTDIASQSKALAISVGLDPVDCCCVFDLSDKATIEMRLKYPVDKKLVKSMLPKISTLSSRNLEKPVFEEYEDYLKVIFKEKPTYKVISSGVQFCATAEKYSGDTWSVFTDENGWLYAVICDGMGTGSKAAISSGLAVNLLEKLLKAGFGIESAIATVNTSLISKSGEECSVTLDLVAFDLYSGRMESYKCGAQGSVIKRRGKISDFTSDTLPLGILKETDIKENTVDLGVGDIILMCSDGVRDEDFWQIRNALKVFEGGDVNKFTQELSEAVRRSQPQRKDDFTMLVLAISGNR